MDKNRIANMKVAVPVWNERVAPLFDVCQKFCLADIRDDRIQTLTETGFREKEPAAKALQLQEMGVSILICGAISKPVQRLVAARDIQVIPFISGHSHEVIQAWLNNALDDSSYAMPGCCGHRRRCRTGRGPGSRGKGPGF